ncbi:hypothetical protein AB0K52_20385 [Glycomyces sp. NPDC049804]|uniref:hypothetical protein n=1 Tax=Glycomyces sp. NPDC049804 TaxID=3154363 RepID=UPI0034294218
MSILARFHQHVPMVPVPGIQHAWAVDAPVVEVRRYYLARPDGQAFFQINARTSTDEGDLRRFLRFAQKHVLDLSEAVPMVAVGGLRLEHYGCDSAIAVLPAAADFTPTVGRDPQIDSRIYGLFPGWQCEVSGTESELAACYRFRRRIDYPNWERDPQPYIRMAYGYRDADGNSLADSGLSTVDMSDSTSIIKRVSEAESGWVRCENYTGKTVRISFDRRLGFIWGAGDAEIPVEPGEIRSRLWSFTTTGR